ncbi:MAG: HypC/HybG/HupF family hydrogenase formation chaperone, partial [Rhodoferax sp.]
MSVSCPRWPEMCIGIPMQVVQAESGWALVQNGSQRQRVDTNLVEACHPGQWLLVFLGCAREIISAERAAEVIATLDLLAAALEP